MRLRFFVATVLAVAGLGLGSVAVAQAAGVQDVARHQGGCTHTSSGSCIRGGEFCPQASYGHSGWDAVGRRYVCKGSRTHPHWMVL